MADLVRLCKALSDETRIRILKLLEQGELCVCDITAALDMVQPKVSFHLTVLKEAGLIRDRKEGRWVHYQMDGRDDMGQALLHLVSAADAGREALHDRKRLERFMETKKKRSTVLLPERASITSRTSRSQGPTEKA